MHRQSVLAMPASSLTLLFALALGVTNALPWTGAEQTAAYVPHEWSPRPTALPHEPRSLFKRDSVDVDICGWIGANSASAVSCGTGSSCIHDTVHALVGCCTTSGACTEGVYTSCQDTKSPGWASSISIVNNGVLTCSSTEACYQNTFPGNYLQWACGASTQGTSVVTSYNGQASDMRLQVVYTGVTFSAMAASPSSTSTTASDTADTSIPIATSVSPQSLGKVDPAAQTSTSTPATSSSKSNTGAVAGGTVGAVAGVVFIAAVIFFFLRRKQQKQKSMRATGSFMPTSKRGPKGGPLSPLTQGYSFNQQPFQPIRQSPEPDDWVSPSMTSLPRNGSIRRSIFPPASETAYHGSGGVGGLVNIDNDDSTDDHSYHSVANTFPSGVSPQPSHTHLNGLAPAPSVHRSETYSPPLHSQYQPFSPPQPEFDAAAPEQLQIRRGENVPLVSEIDEFSQAYRDNVTIPQEQERHSFVREGQMPTLPDFEFDHSPAVEYASTPTHDYPHSPNVEYISSPAVEEAIGIIPMRKSSIFQSSITRKQVGTPVRRASAALSPRSRTNDPSAARFEALRSIPTPIAESPRSMSPHPQTYEERDITSPEDTMGSIPLSFSTMAESEARPSPLRGANNPRFSEVARTRGFEEQHAENFQASPRMQAYTDERAAAAAAAAAPAPAPAGGVAELSTSPQLQASPRMEEYLRNRPSVSVSNYSDTPPPTIARARPSPPQIQTEGWTPRQLHIVRAKAESIASGRSSQASMGSFSSKDLEVPERSPFRDRMSFGLSNTINDAISPAGSRTRYQVVDDVMGGEGSEEAAFKERMQMMLQPMYDRGGN